jgi:methylmalonyl-CoA mutase C-terminal domain/subunit
LGVSLLSGAHLTIVPRLLDRLRERGAGDIVVMLGGVIPDADAVQLKALGVAEVFLQDTPPDVIVARVRAHVAARRSGF